MNACAKLHKPNSNGRYLSKSSTDLAASPPRDCIRRTASYKPNIWSHDFIESLSIKYKGEMFEPRAAKLKDDLMKSITNSETNSCTSKRQFINKIRRLGLSDLFKQEETKTSTIGTDTSFGLLQNEHSNDNTNGGIQLIKAQGGKGSVALTFTKNVKGNFFDNLDDSHLQKLRTLRLQREVPWFDARKQIEILKAKVYEDGSTDLTLLNIAALNFNTVQALHQEELKDLAIWWRNLGLIQEMSFARDRLVESFLFAVGVAHEPRYSLLRKSLAKVIVFILLIDDVYDIYGFLHELECFTGAVESWDVEEIHSLPESMKACFKAFYDTTNDIARVIEKETGRPDAFILITKAWADFCKSLLVEARWYYGSCTPSLDQYLSSAWISSSGPLLSVMVNLLSIDDPSSVNKLIRNRESQKKIKDDLVYHSSLIVRLCNDLGTSKAELERGDSPSSILCYMREMKVTEDVARQNIEGIIQSSWDTMEDTVAKQSLGSVDSINLIVNIARVARSFYSKGDGFGDHESGVPHEINRILVDPIVL